MANCTVMVRAISKTDIVFDWIPYFENVTEEQADRWISASKNFTNVEYTKRINSAVTL